jgi:imidazole glycerol-phosphate synthase subunit HisH
VGSFADGMAHLSRHGWVDALRAEVAHGKPLLGICLGMQMLASMSEEFGHHEGLGLVPGQVRAVPDRAVDGQAQKIPHVGWTALLAPRSGSARWAGSPLEDTPEATSVYLVHSFAVMPDDESDRLADCEYGGHRLCAAVRRDNVFGTQFHPEKSGHAGLAMLQRFLRL